MKQKNQQNHTKGAIRYAEKRRTSTCIFADRVAKVSIQSFREHIPSKWREQNKYVCLATIVACWKYVNAKDNKDGRNEKEKCADDADIDIDINRNDISSSDGCELQVIGLGVGTKFLSKDALLQENKQGEEGEVGEVGEEDTMEKQPQQQQKLQKQKDYNIGNNNKSTIPFSDASYGKRIRDSHAEILARRAFRKYLINEMHSLLPKINPDPLQQQCGRSKSILNYNETKQTFHLKNNVTIHMYTSSTPCGNSSIKKFAQMSKEKFQSQLQPNQWSTEKHEPSEGHSKHLGQFSLLVKKDFTSTAVSNNSTSMATTSSAKIEEEEKRMNFQPPLSKKQKLWPSIRDDQWCPPGTSTVYHGKGSIHTCSDKICRWNCIGLQGSLLASILDNDDSNENGDSSGCPIYMSSLTVGRKFTRCICQRAICCRANGFDNLIEKDYKKKARMRIERENDKCHENSDLSGVGSLPTNVNGIKKFSLNHPSIMGTGVYLDESGVLDMSISTGAGQDVRFLSNKCWIWWPTKSSDLAECIDGETGLKVQPSMLSEIDGKEKQEDEIKKTTSTSYSEASTFSFTKSFLDLLIRMKHEKVKKIYGEFYCIQENNDGDDANYKNSDTNILQSSPHEEHLSLSLKSLRKIKWLMSPQYENAKEVLFHQHVVFRHWRRRYHS